MFNASELIHQYIVQIFCTHTKRSYGKYPFQKALISLGQDKIIIKINTFFRFFPPILMICQLHLPRTTCIINITQDFYLTPSLFPYALIPCLSENVHGNHSNNGAGVAYAHSNFGRRNNEPGLKQVNTPMSH